MHEYSQNELKKLFGLSAPLIRALTRAGHLTPHVERRKTRYSFRDLVLLRMAGGLRAARISPSKIIAALGALRATLSSDSSLTSRGLATEGSSVLVREGLELWEAQSGQYALPLTAPAGAARVIELDDSVDHDADVLYAQGYALEESDIDAARAAYEEALAHRDHPEARINLGRLLHLAGQLVDAERVYREAKSASALLAFNLAVLLEDQGRDDEAVDAYRDALARDPTLIDAHFNLARLHERAKRPQKALEHLLAYRRLTER